MLRSIEDAGINGIKGTAKPLGWYACKGHYAVVGHLLYRCHICSMLLPPQSVDAAQVCVEMSQQGLSIS